MNLIDFSAGNAREEHVDNLSVRRVDQRVSVHSILFHYFIGAAMGSIPGPQRGQPPAVSVPGDPSPLCRKNVQLMVD